MRRRNWLVVGALICPGLVWAQTVKDADIVGAWVAELEHAEDDEKSRGWLVLWPDGLWWYGGPLMWHGHGGARWRLVGDTLWLSNDYEPYFHPMIEKRIWAMNAKGQGLAVMDSAVMKERPSFPIPDSLYWSKAFLDSTTHACTSGEIPSVVCGMWVYQVSIRGPQRQLIRLDRLSRATKRVATQILLRRDSLLHCDPLSGCR